jgi:hypothetical protein
MGKRYRKRKSNGSSGYGSLMGNMKDTMGLGVGSMAGMGVMGAMGSTPGMPKAAGGITGTVGSSMSLLNTGQMAKNAMSITNMMKKWK